MSAVLILRESEVAELLSMRDAIEAVERAFLAVAEGAASFPLRSVVRASEGLLGAMPGAIGGEHAALGAKLVTVFPGNAVRGAHTHDAAIVLFSSETGRPLALLDGRYITEIRTAAASAVATHALANPRASVAAIIGTGTQARSHVHALHEISSFEEIRIWGRDSAKASHIAAEARERGIRASMRETIADACRGADVVCTVTSSAEPVLALRDVDAGTHINAVGACTPRSRELAADLVGHARVVCDSLDGALNEAGDLLLAAKDGALKSLSDVALLSDVLARKVVVRKSPDDITIFESLGVAVEDLACAQLVYERARARSVGVKVDL